jgi:hypothetical protein
MATAKDRKSEFNFNLDLNSGKPIGLSEYSYLKFLLLSFEVLHVFVLILNCPFSELRSDSFVFQIAWTQSLNGGGARSSASQAYLTPSVRKRPNLSIVVNTQVTRVLPVGAASKKDFRTVEVGTPGGSRKSFTATQEVVLAAGTISTPHILLNSGIGDKGDLRALGIPVVHELKDVGKNLQDHVSTVAFGTTTRPDIAP